MKWWLLPISRSWLKVIRYSSMPRHLKPNLMPAPKTCWKNCREWRLTRTDLSKPRVNRYKRFTWMVRSFLGTIPNWPPKILRPKWWKAYRYLTIWATRPSSPRLMMAAGARPLISNWKKIAIKVISPGRL